MRARPQACLYVAIWLCLAGPLASQEREVIGYFPSWKRTAEGAPLSLADIPIRNLTILNYAFFYPLSDGSLAGKDSVGDKAYLRTSAGGTLIDRAHRHGVKVMLSIGGWEDSGNFPSVAADLTLRASFARSCLDAIRTYHFDGIDVDWEYPGYADHNGTAADKKNFTLLLKTLRDSLTAEGARRHVKYLLTAALPAGAANASQIELGEVAGILDLSNMMTYDFHGPWDALANHNSPLYPSAGADSMRCVDAAFRLYRHTHGVKPSQITLGIPLYGHTYTRCTALNTAHAGQDTIHFSASGAFYADILRYVEDCERFWDQDAQAPYLVNETWDVLISYDDVESVRAKAQYVLDHKIRGVILWEITGDRLPDGTTPLQDVIGAMLHPSVPTDH